MSSSKSSVEVVTERVGEVAAAIPTLTAGSTSHGKRRALWWVLGITGVTAAAVALYRRARPPAEDPWATPAYFPVEHVAGEETESTEPEDSTDSTAAEADQR